MTSCVTPERGAISVGITEVLRNNKNQPVAATKDDTGRMSDLVACMSRWQDSTMVPNATSESQRQ